GRQFIARIDGTGVGFATVYWTWSTLSAARVGTLYDLFVADGTRGRGVGRRLLNAVLTACREHGAVEMVWQTALDNTVAQRLYDGIGAEQSRWLDYSLPATAVLPE
ncbi:MAG TPA: GNAT family N-acetyltransferase, partial [Acidimicrobiales bacterium]|nr:GNAT family N-acetyltransferase [Acidimicrobiales bacterium]